MPYGFVMNMGALLGLRDSLIYMVDKPLICPECASKVAWNGVQFVCLACDWSEHKEKPPSSGIIAVPKQARDRSTAPTKEPKSE